MSVAARQPQWREALDAANRIRMQRADLRRILHGVSKRAGRKMAADVIERNDPDVWTMRLDSLITACWYTGEGKLRRYCLEAKVRPKRQIGDLTMRERTALAEALRADAQ